MDWTELTWDRLEPFGAALAGALVGGTMTLLGAWLTQNREHRHTRELAKLNPLITECQNLLEVIHRVPIEDMLRAREAVGPLQMTETITKDFSAIQDRMKFWIDDYGTAGPHLVSMGMSLESSFTPLNRPVDIADPEVVKEYFDDRRMAMLKYRNLVSQAVVALSKQGPKIFAEKVAKAERQRLRDIYDLAEKHGQPLP